MSCSFFASRIALVATAIAGMVHVASAQDKVAEEPPVPAMVSDVDECAEMTAGVSFKSISEIVVQLHPTAELIPPDCSSQMFAGYRSAHDAAPNISLSEFHWEPTNFFHYPLYFDDTPLERYGQSLCPPLQPAISGARFFLTFPVIPYKMGVDRTHDCITTLGHHRPGNCAPCTREVLFRGHPSAALLQAATTVGLVFLLP